MLADNAEVPYVTIIIQPLNALNEFVMLAIYAEHLNQIQQHYLHFLNEFTLLLDGAVGVSFFVVVSFCVLSTFLSSFFPAAHSFVFGKGLLAIGFA